MRVLVVGANLAGLLSARHLRQQGHEVTLLVEGPEVATQAMPPFVFSDPGPWGAAQGAFSTLGAMLKDCRELRLGLDGLAYSGWLAHCIGRRFGGRARSQALQALAMARRSQIVFDQLKATAALPGSLETVSMLSLYRDGHLAKTHSQRGPMWHLGSPPTLCDTAGITALLPQLDSPAALLRSGLQSQGQMLADGAALMATLRQQLVNAGVRFIFDHHIDGAVHAGQHLHAVTLRGRLGLTEELDTDLAVATSRPLAQPLLRALGLAPRLAPLTQWRLRTRLADVNDAAQWVHDQHSGVRLTRRGQDLWAQGPAWLGQPDGSPNQELAHLSAAITRHFGQRWSVAAEAPLEQTHWVAPDGLPLVSRTSTRNLLLNLGHYSGQPTFAFGALALLDNLLQAGRPSAKTPAPRPSWSVSQVPLPAAPQGLSHD